MKKKLFILIAMLLAAGIPIVLAKQKSIPVEEKISLDASQEYLTEEQIQQLRSEYPLAQEGALAEYIPYTLEEFLAHIPIIAIGTVQGQLENYTVVFNQPSPENGYPGSFLEFEQYQFRVDECITSYQELEGEILTIAIRKDRKNEYPSLQKGTQLLLPLEPMSGSHSGKYTIGYDVSFYLVKGYLLAASQKDYGLNGMRLDKANLFLKPSEK